MKTGIAMDDTLFAKKIRNAGSRGPFKGGRCSVCHEPLAPEDIFCSNCGPPESPDLDPEDEGASRSEALLRIAALVLVFILIAFFKLDMTVGDLIPDFLVPSPEEVELEKPTDEDFKVFHTVNVSQANVRENPSMKGKIVTVVDQGMPLEVLESQGRWTKIRVNEKIGWISNKLLTSEVR
ncbi:MAG: SH3 domain-containing protein [Nitrospinaceae bacterium]